MPTATAKQLLDALQAIPADRLDEPFYIWLPGSLISIGDKIMHDAIGKLGVAGHGRKLVVEGNVVPGSALAP